MPTKRKNEFEEYNFLMDKNFKLIKLSKRVRFEENKIGKPKRLNSLETNLLSELRFRRRIPIADIDKLKLGDTTDIGNALRRLASFKLVIKDAKNVYAENYSSYLMRELPELEYTYIPNKEFDQTIISKEAIKAYQATFIRILV
jgi:hypothetical protein